MILCVPLIHIFYLRIDFHKTITLSLITSDKYDTTQIIDIND